MKRWARRAGWALAAALFVGVAFAAQAGLGAGEEVEIVLDDAGSRASGAGVEIDGATVAVRAAGVYRVRGSLSDGQILVKVDQNSDVTLVLDGVELSNSSEPAILVENAGRATLRLAEGSVNRVRSGAPVELSADAADADAGGGAIRAKDDLAIEGPGALIVRGYLNNGIHCSNRLTVSGGEIEVEAVNNGLKGKDGVTIAGGRVSIRSGGDGIDSDAEDGEGYGVIEFARGEVSIESFGDGAQAATALILSGGSLEIASGGGSAAAAPRTSGGAGRGERWDRDDEAGAPSAKGLKAGVALEIRGGSAVIDAADDALHSDGALEISGGALTLASGDDGVHADDSLTVSGGALEITASYEGLEANRILLSGGEMDVAADDDGVNANGGESGWGRGFGGRGGLPNGARIPDRGNFPDGGELPPGASAPSGGDLPGGEGAPNDERVPGGEGAPKGKSGPNGGAFAPDASAGAAEAPLPALRITGGKLRVNAEGDGLDSNGDLVIEGGEVVVDGPSRGGNGALDSGAESGGACLVNGGTVLAIGAAGMDESFDGASGQSFLHYSFEEALPAGSEIIVADANGEILFSHTSAKSFSSVVFSCPELRDGARYTLTAGEARAEAVAGRSSEAGARRWR